MTDKSRSTEIEINKVIVHHDSMLKEIQEKRSHASRFDTSAAEKILKSRGYNLPQQNESVVPLNKQRVVVVRPWNEILDEANRFVDGKCNIESIFTEEELAQNKEVIRMINEEFNQIHRLDKVDVAIGALAGMVGAAVDMLMVGIPQKTSEGLKAGPLSNFIRAYFDSNFPEAEMQKLANSKVSKVPFDAQDNRHTTIRVEGLSAYYHRLLQL